MECELGGARELGSVRMFSDGEFVSQTRANVEAAAAKPLALDRVNRRLAIA